MYKKSELTPTVLCPILEEIAKLYNENSPHEKAIRIAALALHFIFVENQLSSFGEFVNNAERELTNLQKAHLKELGLEP